MYLDPEANSNNLMKFLTMLCFILRIKQKKEQQCFVEEQRTLRLGSHRAPYSEQKMSDRFSQLQLEEMKGAKEKMQQKEKEYVR